MEASRASGNAAAQTDLRVDEPEVLLLTTEQIEPLVGIAADTEVLVLDQELDPEPAPVGPIEDPFLKISPAHKRPLSGAPLRTVEPLLPRVVHHAREPVFPFTKSGLESQLEDARRLAALARRSEDRTNAALYQALSCAYDFALAVQAAPEELATLLSRAGLVMQDRAPMTPIVKLVFGSGYDKTRLTEYAAVLSHARRLQIGRGKLAEHLFNTSGGIKAVVEAERQLRRRSGGKAPRERTGPREVLAKALRALPTRGMSDVSPEGDEFVLVLARRLPGGEVAMVGEVPRDVPLLERAASALVRKSP